MNINLSLWLFVALVVTGTIILLDRWLLKPKQLYSKEPWPVEISRSFFSVIAFVFVLRSFLFEPFQIPSGSMIPTLKVGDFIIVNKFAYGLRVPVLGNTIVPIGEPKRGDVMVFIPPSDNRHFIKRVIGLPGDVVEFKNNDLVINGEQISQESASRDIYDYGGGLQSTILKDAQTGEHKHKIQLARNSFNPYGKTGKYQVPEGHYLMIGDNRDGSADSRSCFGLSHCNQPPSKDTPHAYGWSAVPEKNIVGKASYVWMHWKERLSIPSFSTNRVIQ